MRLTKPVTAVSFWIGTLLPVAYLPVILMGIDSVTMLSLFVGLLTINVFALVLGHDYSGRRTR
ncbi:hypothetical protein ACLI4Z_12780 [Natrialbaceae archaeon A-arb3/5]